MAYEKKTWENGEVLYADDLNDIEDGIYDNAVTQTSISGNTASFKNAAGVTVYTLNIGG